VVAAKRNSELVAHDVHARTRVCSVTDDVAEAPKLVYSLSLGSRQHRVKRLEVGVDV
jgi:hypothetical protein